MRKYGVFLLQIIAIFCPCIVNALHSFDDYIEQIYQRHNFTEEQDFESIREALQDAYAVPLDLNNISQEELSSLGILYEDQIKNYFNHIAHTGALYALYELQAIPSFDLTTITLLVPFVYVVENYGTPSKGSNHALSQGNSFFLFRYETPIQSTTHQQSTQKRSNSAPLGNLDKYIAQSFLKYNNDMTWGITARKQGGEAFYWDHDTHRYGFNLWSVFVQLDGQKYFKRMVIGDYQVGYGQGLLLSSGYFLPKGSDVHTIICSHNTGIRPYKGIRRVGLRGLAITSVLGGIELTAFYATNNLDAKIAIGEDGQPYTRHIDPTGKYDTNNNLKKKGTVHEQVVGTTILRKSNRNQTELGINIMYNYYDVPILTEENYAVPYLLQGQCALATSLFYRFLWKNIILFGEYGINFSDPATKNKQGKHAVIQGILISLSRYVDFSSSIYYYGTGFYSPYGGSVHATDNANKKGLNAIVKLTPCPSWQIVADWHTFAVLHPKTRSSIVGSGNHFTTRSCYVFNRKTLFTIQQRFKEGPKANSKFKQNKTIQDNKDKAIKNSIKCKVDHQITPAWRTNIEAQYVYHAYSNQTYHGYAASSRQKWKVKKWQLSWKITGFKAEDYTTRLYFHEPGPLYGGTRFTPYYGNGIATSFLVCWKPISWFHLALKYGLVYAVSDLHQIAKPKSTRSSLSTQNKQNGLIQVIVRL